MKIFMETFNNLLTIAKTLLGPNGCPWDHKQTFESLKKYVLEEAHELAEAIENRDDLNILEEAGDLLYIIIFIAEIAKKEQKFTLEDVCKGLSEKLIRRQ